MLRLRASVTDGIMSDHAIPRRVFLRTTGFLALSGGAVAMVGCGGDADDIVGDIDDVAMDDPADDLGGDETVDDPLEDGDDGDIGPPADETPEGVEVEMDPDLLDIGGFQIVDDDATLRALDTDNGHGGEDPLILVRVDADTVAANTLTCTHQQCDVEYDGGAALACPCHGSQFKLDGSVRNGPAARPLLNYEATIHEGSVFLVKA
jgi:Rieske Fe-S protein